MKKTITILGVLLLMNFILLGQNQEVSSEVYQQKKNAEMYQNMIIQLSPKANQRIFKNITVKGVSQTGSGYFGAALSIKQRLDSMLYHEFDLTTNQWAGQSMEAYSYDSNGNNTMYVSLSRDDSVSTWMKDSKDEYSYDANGLWILGISYSWVDSLSQWEKDYRAEISYDNNQNTLLELLFTWDDTNNQWDSIYKTAYNYNASGLLSDKISSYFNSTNSQWQFSSKSLYAYDSNGNIVQMISSYWDGSTSQWVDNGKYEYTFDANGNKILGISYYWSSTAWIKSSKYDYSYDSNGNLTQDIYSSWDSNLSQWKPGQKLQYFYDNSYAYADLLLPKWAITENTYFNHQLTDYKSFDWVDSISAYVQDAKGILYYSSQNIVSVEEANNQTELKVYPNPFSNSLYFDISGNFEEAWVEIFDVRGQRFISKQIKHNERINTKGLSAGLYFYTILIDGRIYKGKVLKNNQK